MLEAIGPVWVKCHNCEEYWCVTHKKHVYECSCPPIEEWEDVNPYAEKASKGDTTKKSKAAYAHQGLGS